jgi:hypothetical protein
MIKWVADKLKGPLGFDQTDEIAGYLLTIEDDAELVLYTFPLLPPSLL